MRVYCEDQLIDDLVGDADAFFLTTYVPSTIGDAGKCQNDLEVKKWNHLTKGKGACVKAASVIV
eukprot:1670087-Ditylum_brightwellii.AAC.1